MAFATFGSKPISDSVMFDMNDGSTILFSDVYENEGHGPLHNDPADLEYSPETTLSYYDNVIGRYPVHTAAFNGTFAIYNSRLDGVAALINYLEFSTVLQKSLTSNSNLTIGDISDSGVFGGNGTPGTGDYPQLVPFGLDPNILYSNILEEPLNFTLWAESIIEGEGSNKGISVEISLASSPVQIAEGVSTGAQISLSVAYDVNFSDTLGGTEIDLDNDLAVSGAPWPFDFSWARTASSTRA